MKTAIIATLVGSAAAFAPAPVARVESSLSYAKELDSMAGASNEVGGKVVCVVWSIFLINCSVLVCILSSSLSFALFNAHAGCCRIYFVF
jgi:hypothetical protein